MLCVSIIAGVVLYLRQRNAPNEESGLTSADSRLSTTRPSSGATSKTINNKIRPYIPLEDTPIAQPEGPNDPPQPLDPVSMGEDGRFTRTTQ